MDGNRDMMLFAPELVHSLLTPFKEDNSIDYNTYDKIIEFHLSNGADSLALPMHIGEYVSLSNAEKRDLISFVLKKEKNISVIAHVSDAGTKIAEDLSFFAIDSGASSIVVTTPYYWTPPASMLLEHFLTITKNIRSPIFIHNDPSNMGNAKISINILNGLLASRANSIYLLDSSLDWQFMIELVTLAEKNDSKIQLASGTDYYLSAAAIGANTYFSSLGLIAPKLVRRLYDYCKIDSLFEARKVQEAIAKLLYILKPYGVPGLKAASKYMGRDCGYCREPLNILSDEQQKTLEGQLKKSQLLKNEIIGWNI